MPTNSNWSMAATVSSSSILSAETAIGRHEFKVEGYSCYKGLASGRAIYSGEFRVGGHCWKIIYYPGGFKKESADWISFRLYQHPSAADDDSEVKAEITLSLLDKDGHPVPLYTSASGQCTFSRGPKRWWGFERFIKREDMDSLYLKDGYFCIRCDVTVVLETREESVVPPLEMHQHLGDLLDSKIGVDITFDVGSETFVAHKNILAARSPVFMAEFFGGPMKESVASRVRIHDMEPRVFKAMLHFIYTESVPEIARGEDKIVMAQHLLVAADRYALGRLKSICVANLRMWVNKSVAVTTLVLAEQHGCPQLKEACFKILKSFDSYKEPLVGYDFEDDDLEHLASSCPSLLKELQEAGLCDTVI
ncbi:unnamed protein product [Urochloa humidicola]